MGKNDVFFAIIILKSTLFAEIAVLEAEGSVSRTLHALILPFHSS